MSTFRSLLAFGVFSTLAVYCQQQRPVDTLNQQLSADVRAGRAPAAGALSLRQQLLRAEIRRDPAMARNLILPGDVREALEKEPTSAALIEKAVSYDAGRSYVVDSADWRNAWYGYDVRTPSGNIQAFQDASTGTPPACGSTMRLAGYQLGDTMLVTGSSVVAQDSPLCSTLGDQKVAVVLVQYADAKVTRPVDQYQSVFFGDSQSVNDFYREMSNSKASASGSVIGPITIPHKYDVCDAQHIWNQVLDEADRITDMSQFNRVVVVVPPSSCGFGGVGELSCNSHELTRAGKVQLSMVFQFDADRPEIMRVSPHELGHNLGLNHSRRLSFGPQPVGPDPNMAVRTEYDDTYSSMGGSGPVHFMAAQKLYLKWFSENEIQTVSSGGTFDLISASGSSGGIRALRIQRHVANGQVLWLEYRNGTGYDAGLANRLESGAILHFELVPNDTASYLLGFGPDVVDADLPLGGSWKDPYSDLTISVVESTPDHLRVTVSYDPPCATVLWPQQSSYAGGAFSFRPSIKTADPSCAYTAFANISWLSVAADGLVIAADNPDALRRRGSVTVANQTFIVTQEPVLRTLSLLYFGPGKGFASASIPPSFSLGVSLPNADSTAGSIDLLVNASPSFPQACGVTYNLGTRLLQMLDADGKPTGPTLRAGDFNAPLRNTACIIFGINDVRATPFETTLTLGWRPIASATQTLNAYYRLRTAPAATPSPWQQGATLLAPAPSKCVPSVSSSSVTAGGSGLRLSLVVSVTPSCPWTASAADSWVSVSPASGTAASATLVVNVAANPTSSTRASVIRFNELEIPVLQRPANMNGPVYASFTTPEVHVDRKPGSMAMTFSTNLTAGKYSWSLSESWARVLDSCLNEAGCPQVTFGWDANLDTQPRTVSVRLLTLDGQVVPGGELRLVQDANAAGGDLKLSVVAGRGDVDGDVPLATILRAPSDITVDTSGGLWIAEYNGRRIRRIAADGSVRTAVGNWLPSGQVSGSASEVRVPYPTALVATGSGDLYFADNGLLRISKLSADGTVSVVAGTGAYGSGGDGASAALASFRSIAGIAISGDGTMYVADPNSHRIRKISADGMITTVAGNGTPGFSGDGGDALQARLNYPSAVVIASDGSLIIADQNNYRLRRVGADGVISTFAGTGVCGVGGDGGAATAATICVPKKLAITSDGRILVGADNRVRSIDTAGRISTVAGATARTILSSVSGIALGPDDTLFVADSTANQVYQLQDGTLIPVAGYANTDYGDSGGAAISVRLNTPAGMALDSAGNLYVADTLRHQLFRITPGGISEIAAGAGTYSDTLLRQPAVSASLPRPVGVVAHPDGGIYIGTFCNVKRFDPFSGFVTVYAGSTSCGFNDSSSPINARFYGISQITLAPDGSMYVADSFNNRVRRIAPNGAVSTVAGSGVYGDALDGVDAVNSPMRTPQGVAISNDGVLYIADSSNYRIRAVGPDGKISTFAGGRFGFSGDGRLTRAAAIGVPQFLSIAPDGSLWFADSGNHTVWQATTDGRLHVMAGLGRAGFSQPGLPAWAEPLYNPLGIFASPNGVFLSESATGRVSKVAP